MQPHRQGRPHLDRHVRGFGRRHDDRPRQARLTAHPRAPLRVTPSRRTRPDRRSAFARAGARSSPPGAPHRVPRDAAARSSGGPPSVTSPPKYSISRAIESARPVSNANTRSWARLSYFGRSGAGRGDGGASASTFESEPARDVDHAALSRPVRRRASGAVLRRGIGAGRDQQVHDRHRLRVVVRQPPERRVAVRVQLAWRSSGILAQDLAQAIDVAAERERPDVPACIGSGSRSSAGRSPCAAQPIGVAVVARLARIDLGAALDQERRRAQRHWRRRRGAAPARCASSATSSGTPRSSSSAMTSGRSRSAATNIAVGDRRTPDARRAAPAPPSRSSRKHAAMKPVSVRSRRRSKPRRAGASRSAISVRPCRTAASRTVCAGLNFGCERGRHVRAGAVLERPLGQREVVLLHRRVRE